LWEDQPSVPSDCESLAGCINSWENTAAEDVVNAGLPIDSLSIVYGVVELLSANVVGLFVADDALDEGDLVGVVEYWRGESKGKDEAEQHCDDMQHNKYLN
jgi:hypothetical protein